VDLAVPGRPTEHATRGRLHTPVCVFLIVYGVAKLAELADWSRLHHDLAAMLGRGSGTVTGLLLAGKGAELVLTALAVLALTRRGAKPLFAALIGWSADLAVLTIVAGTHGDRGRLLEHGVTFVAVAGLLVVTYVFGGAQGTNVVHAVPPAPEPRETPPDVAPVAPDPGATRQDLPVRGSGATRRDLHVRPPDAPSPDVTRQDLPVRGRPAPEPPRDR
jgi:hypothetical protein